MKDKSSSVSFGVPTQQPINLSRTLPQQVYENLKSLILEQKLKPGQRLKIDDLKQHFAVSTTPIREALMVLAKEGLVLFKPHAGYYVAKPSVKEIGDAFEIRKIFETYAVAAAIEVAKKNPQQWKIFLREFRVLKNSEPLDLSLDAKAKSLDEQLHRVLVSATGNQMLLTLWTSARNITRVAYQLSARTYYGISEHLELVESILRGDLEGAVGVIQTHLQNARDYLLREINSRTEVK